MVDLWNAVDELVTDEPEVSETEQEPVYVEKPMSLQAALANVDAIRARMNGVAKEDWDRYTVLEFLWSLQEARRPRFDGSQASGGAKFISEQQADPNAYLNALTRVGSEASRLVRRLEAPKSKFTGEPGSFRTWKRGISIWVNQYVDDIASITPIEDKRIGAALIDAISGAALDIVTTRVESGDETYTTIMAVLVSAYEASKLPEALEAMRKFEAFERADGSSLLTFLNQFMNLRSRAEATGGPMGHTVGHVLLTKARLSAPNHTGVMRYVNSAPGGLNSNNFPDYEAVVAQLKLMNDGYEATATQNSSRPTPAGKGKGKGVSTAMVTASGWDDIGGFWMEKSGGGAASSAYVAEDNGDNKKPKSKPKAKAKAKKKHGAAADGGETWKPWKPSGKGGGKGKGKGKGGAKGGGKGAGGKGGKGSSAEFRGKPVCYEFRDTGKCQWGAECRFTHEKSSGAPKQGRKRPRDDEDSEEIEGMTLTIPKGSG
jgi:hypothetical protein